MVLLTLAQLRSYNELGYVVLPIPCPELVETLLSAAMQLQQRSTPEEVAAVDTKGNHWRLRPQVPGSYWGALDMSLPALQVCLHPDIVEVGRQVTGVDDIWMRNGGINELAPGRSAQWHHDGGDEGVEFMSYFNGTRPSNGCLRVIPGSHHHPTVLPTQAEQVAAGNPPTVFDIDLAERRAAQGVVNPGAWKDGAPEDVLMPGEVSLTLRPDELLVRNTRIFHATHVNKESSARLMSHWGFKNKGAGDIGRADSPLATGRMRFDKCLTPTAQAELSAEQRSILRIGRAFDLDPIFADEREREEAIVRFGTLEEVLAGAGQPWLGSGASSRL
jgi:hypothetical protein